MTGWAALLTAAAAAVSALGGLVVAVTLLLPTLRAARSTHEIVNQHQTDMSVYQRDLQRALTVAGIEIPDDKSLPGASDEPGQPG